MGYANTPFPVLNILYLTFSAIRTSKGSWIEGLRYHGTTPPLRATPYSLFVGGSRG